MPFISQTQVAASVPFDNTGTSLTATNVQDAIVSIENGIVSGIPAHSTTHLPNGNDPLQTGSPVTLNAGLDNEEGTANAFARTDHIHRVPTAIVVNTSTTNTEGSSTSFARADHTHNTTIANQFVSATANTSTTSNTATLLNLMTLTVAVSGTYLIKSNVVFIAGGNNTTTIGVYLNGNLIPGTNGSYQRNANNTLTHSGFTITALQASDVVQIRWNTSGGTQITANLRSLGIIRLGT